MCFYRRYIFLGCGHCTFSSRPISHCAPSKAKGKAEENPSNHTELSPSSSAAPLADSLRAEECEASKPPRTTTKNAPEKCLGPQIHPSQTYRIHSLCLECARQREALLAQAEDNTVRFEPWKWKVRYTGTAPVEVPFKDWNVGEVMGSWVAGIGQEVKKSGLLAALSSKGPQSRNADIEDEEMGGQV
jgi:hypothetical protein